MTFTSDRKVWQPYLWDVYHRLHQIPEISGQEFKTSSFLKAQPIYGKVEGVAAHGVRPHWECLPTVFRWNGGWIDLESRCS